MWRGGTVCVGGGGGGGVEVWREVDWITGAFIIICYLAVPSDQTYIACEWQTDMKDEYFDLQTATVRNLTLFPESPEACLYELLYDTAHSWRAGGPSHTYTHTHTPCHSPSQHIRDDASYSKVEEESRRSIHLIDCMQLFTEKETLGKDDAWLAHTYARTQSVPV